MKNYLNNALAWKHCWDFV